MEFIQLKCPNCQATLEIEDSLDTFFCKYCGTRIAMSNLDPALIEAKTKLKMADKQLELEKERHRQAIEKEILDHQYERSGGFIALGVMFALLILIIIAAKILL